MRAGTSATTCTSSPCSKQRGSAHLATSGMFSSSMCHLPSLAPFQSGKNSPTTCWTRSAIGFSMRNPLWSAHRRRPTRLSKLSTCTRKSNAWNRPKLQPARDMLGKDCAWDQLNELAVIGGKHFMAASTGLDGCGVESVALRLQRLQWNWSGA